MLKRTTGELTPRGTPGETGFGGLVPARRAGILCPESSRLTIGNLWDK